MRTLVRLPNWVGDTILALPALEGLARLAGEDWVFAGRSQPLGLTRHIAPGAPRIALRDSGSGGMGRVAETRVLRARRPDRALLLTPSFSAALSVWAAGIRERIGWAEQGRGRLLSRRMPRMHRGQRHLCDEFCDLAQGVGAADFPRGPRLPDDPAARAAAEDHLNRALGDRRHCAAPGIALCPGTQYGPAKRWPAEHFCDLRRRLEQRGAVGWTVGSPAEAGAGARVLEGAGPGWANLAGAGDLMLAAELLRAADLAVCNDTGALHLAAAVGTPVVTVFGPTNPAWTGPREGVNRVLQEDHECQPCYARRCSIADTAPCMVAVTPEKVDAAVWDLLGDSGRRGQAAIFLDRDGTLCELIPYLKDPAHARLAAGSGLALRRAQEAGYRVVVVTNQAGIARGLFGAAEVHAVHRALTEQLAVHGVRIDSFQFCPHHPDFTGPCSCRKPQPGMLRQAANAQGLDLSRSIMIGDTVEDLLAGEAAGCRLNILVETGYGKEQLASRPGALLPRAAIARDLPAAIELALAPVKDA